MILWLLIAAMACACALVAARPLLRAADGDTETVSALSILKDQLRALQAQVEKGELTAIEAAPLKLEIERRILSEARTDEAAARPLGAAARARTAFILGAAIAVSAVGLYTLLGRPDVDSAVQQAASLSDSEGDITRLRRLAEAAPGDPEAWRRLGFGLFQSARFNEAADAYRGAAALAPQSAISASALGEALTGAAEGRVTDQAATAFAAALAADPADPRARYFLALRKDQTGDRDGAMADWIALVNSAPPGAPWAAEVRRFVEQTARERGVDLTGRLTGEQAPRGPDAEQMAAAQALSPEDQEAMIAGMVGQLEDRLAQSPRDAEGWARLMQARMVLGEPDRARKAWRDGRAALAGDVAAQGRLDVVARQLGVPEG